LEYALLDGHMNFIIASQMDLYGHSQLITQTLIILKW
jgi:hypothetical protein